MISRSGRHAIRALLRLAESPGGSFIGVSALARAVEAPGNYLGKLLHTLARAGVVESRKGPGGGFRLARPPERISLLDVLEPLEPPGRWEKCLLGLPTCSDEAPCALHSRWESVRREHRSLLSRTTLADIVEENRRCGKVHPEVPAGKEARGE